MKKLTASVMTEVLLVCRSANVNVAQLTVPGDRCPFLVTALNDLTRIIHNKLQVKNHTSSLASADSPTPCLRRICGRCTAIICTYKLPDRRRRHYYQCKESYKLPMPKTSCQTGMKVVAKRSIACSHESPRRYPRHASTTSRQELRSVLIE